MSQGPVFVQATDGKFYKNPAVFGADWWVCFDDEDDPEVIVRRFKNSTPQLGRTRVKKVLTEAGVEFRELRYHQRCERIFPPTWDRFLEAYVFTFRLTGPIPVPGKFDAVVDDVGAVWDWTIYGFFSDFPSEACARTVLGMDVDRAIARALLAQPIYKKTQEKVRPEICKKLYAAAPWLRGLTKNNWQEQLRDKPEKVRVKWRLS